MGCHVKRLLMGLTLTTLLSSLGITGVNRVCTPAQAKPIQSICPESSRLKVWDSYPDTGHSLVIAEGGKVLAWGANGAGQLGLGDSRSRYRPEPLDAVKDARMVAFNDSSSLILTGDGAVWVAGDNDNGFLGDRSHVACHTPVRVESLPPVRAVSAGWNRVLALAEDGTVWEWGWVRTFGTPIQGPRAVTYHPSRDQRAVPLDRAVAVAAGMNFALVLRDDGSVWCWGSGGDVCWAQEPERLAGVTDGVAIAVGNKHALVLRADGTVWGAGDGDLYELGGAKTDREELVPIPGVADVVAIAAGKYSSLALRKDGSVLAWGDNRQGRLGTGETADTLPPTPVPNLPPIRQIAAGEYHALALAVDGTLWAWGYNGNGAIGNGFFSEVVPQPEEIPTPRPVIRLPGVSASER